uniref:Rad51-like C-terminal domain-containing protein n=1 Tax=Ananas comosus var. bracteatus TaxID=296719 RepID=A0A6V7QSS6_ANACO
MIDVKFEDQGQLQLLDREEAEEEEDCFESIDKLISQGINAGDIKKLQDAGIYTYISRICLQLCLYAELDRNKGLSEAKVDKICEAAEKLVNMGYVTGSDLLLRRKSVIRITTGSQALDELLGGGIETLSITEAFGEFRFRSTCTVAMGRSLTSTPRERYMISRPDRIVRLQKGLGWMPTLSWIISFMRERIRMSISTTCFWVCCENGRRALQASDRGFCHRSVPRRLLWKGGACRAPAKVGADALPPNEDRRRIQRRSLHDQSSDCGSGWRDVHIGPKEAGGRARASACIHYPSDAEERKGEQRVCKIFDAPNLPEAEAISFAKFLLLL